jgi:CHAT domain-containing protein
VAFAPLLIDTLVGEAATEPAVRAALPVHRLGHLATPGFVTARRGDVLGGLALSRPAGAGSGTEDDGLLQLFEIYALRLDAELVVLSACETARGPRVAGEGVFALSRGFLAAGARRAIASLWPVNDASTAELMSALFQRLAAASHGAGRIDYPALVRDAKRTLRARAETADPFHWAPFVLSGAW